MNDGYRDLSVPRPIDEPVVAPLAPGAELAVLDDAKVFAAPDDPRDRERWRQALEAWRTGARRRIDYDDRLYVDGPSWPADCGSVFLVWLWDDRLWDGRRFTVEAYCERMVQDFGRVDAVVLWHAYPVIGLDERNQWDFYRDVRGLDDVVNRFHELGVKVFCDYNPWDVGTRRAPGPDARELADVVARFGFDGVFLDTLKAGAPEIGDALGRFAVLEGESRVPLEAVATHALSWAQWFADTEAPGVLRAHWFERRHMMHHVRRWNRDHSAELQSAWVNGVGMLVWDDVFGVWVGWNARDRSTLRALSRVRHALADVFRDGEWTPLADLPPDAEAAGVHAHRYDHDGLSLWTLVNRGDRDWTGTVTDAVPVDVTHGVDTSTGEVWVPARGIAGVVTAREGHPRWPELRALADAGRGDHDPDVAFPALDLTTRAGERAAPVATAPPDTVTVAGRYRLTVRYRRRETGQDDEVRWIDAWKPLPPELHAVVTAERVVDLTPVAVDRHEVTNAAFHRFVTQTGYRPVVAHRFLAPWSDGAPAPGTEDDPVTYVDPDDARAFARWAGRRLPTRDEWQAALETGAGHLAPRVWNWTDPTYCDGVTQWAHLKGGSDWRAEGSDWYVDGGPQDPRWELKLVLPGGGLARSSRVGFRTCVDVSTAGAS